MIKNRTFWNKRKKVQEMINEGNACFPKETRGIREDLLDFSK